MLYSSVEGDDEGEYAEVVDERGEALGGSLLRRTG